MKPMHNADSIEDLVRGKGLEVAIDELSEENARVRGWYLSGGITFAEAHGMLFRPFIADRAARVAGLSWSPRGAMHLKSYSWFTCTSQAAYKALCADHSAWLSGAIPDASDKVPWLFNRGYNREIEPNSFLAYINEEVATPDDKAVFFSLLDAAFRPIELFAPPPDDMMVPIDEINLEAGSFGLEHWAEGIYCTMDVSCLMSGGDPIGRRVDLPLDDGGVVHATITEMEINRDYLPPFDPIPESVSWRAVGWVEGYTCDIEREIELGGLRGRMEGSLIMAQVPEDVERADREAYRTCSLWAPFRDWEIEYLRSWRAAADQAIASFLTS